MTFRIHPLSEQQERRLLDYLDEKYLDAHQDYTRRHEPESKIPTLRAYLLAMQSLLSLTLQVPPVPPSGMLRISLLLRLTGTVMGDIIGYSPDDADLIPLLEWLDILDRGWHSVLCRRAWDSERGEGVGLPEELLENTPPPTQTDCTRVHSLLVTGISALENWVEGKDGDEEGDLVRGMQRLLGHPSSFNELFRRTLTKLDELRSDEEGDDEEELLARLPRLSTAEGDHVAGMDMDRVDMEESKGGDEDVEALYMHT